MRKLMVGALTVAAILSPMIAMAVQAITVVQKGRAFSASSITISHGDMVRFTNEDDFAHQLNIRGPNMEIDSDLQEEGNVVSATFPHSGVFNVRCGIHPRMRLTVRVE